MRIVCRKHQAVGQRHQIILLVSAQASVDALQHILQEGRACALLRAAADLFIVEHAEERHACACLRSQEALQSGKDALQIVQPAAGHIFLLQTNGRRRHPVIKEKLHIHKLLRTNTAPFSHQPLQTALRRKAAHKRQHIRLRVELKALVRLFIHMDSQIRNHQQILLNIQQARLQPALHAAQHASGQRQRPVQPCIQQHTAILFYIQLHVPFVHHDFRVMLQLKRRRIAVAGINLKAEILRLRQHKGQQR